MSWPERRRLKPRGAGELADHEALERLDARAPDEGLRRREFLTRTAAAAGGVGAGQRCCRPSTLVAEAARKQRDAAARRRATCRSTPSSC